MHAMTGLNYLFKTNGDFPAAQAISRQLMNEFVYQKGYIFERELAGGNEYQAYFDLGMGMHPLMDQWSPSHSGFQIWYGLTPYGIFTLIPAGFHLAQEAFTLSGISSAVSTVSAYHAYWTTK